MIEALVGSGFGLGLYLILCDRFRVPYFSSVRAARAAAGRKKKRSAAQAALDELAGWIGGKLRLGEYRRARLLCDLKSAGMEISPEAHIAGCAVRALAVAAAAVPACFVFPPAAPVILAAAAARYSALRRAPAERIREKREKIEYGLPGFAAYIGRTLTHSRDVLMLIENYAGTAPPELGGELAVTAADMRSGNYEAALARLGTRVGSPMLSDVTRGLTAVLRGDDTRAYWAALEIKFAERQRQLLRRRAQKAPARVKRLSMCLMFCFILIYAVVIGVEIMRSAGALFG